ncbi:hypothetical protein C9I56_37365 [Paraburkholderia caribensis]|uniref:Uncharacterized protein n=1 Tax=Paraburkholderia caribensis TaxID=75105 RepID=A0A9Q6S6W5_9BURK|nr:hypothetical protein AN416_20540 [Paraburkholderia caribensis]AUT53848.1 hypothetical protein C2L66_17970 [Paraburkholderia caribensis]PTB23771.1 hypothetical protein C9I56_37365 [Paraburkholderia caribensis]QLB65486.1 hypothetical protein A9O66_24225 [Paraburkholderia caribensis]
MDEIAPIVLIVSNAKKMRVRRSHATRSFESHRHSQKRERARRATRRRIVRQARGIHLTRSSSITRIGR